MYNDYMNGGMPMGLGMALAMNTVAMNRFSNLSQREREELFARTHGIESPEEMRAFVDEFGQNGLASM